jgi:hypothetical protein
MIDKTNIHAAAAAESRMKILRSAVSRRRSYFHGNNPEYRPAHVTEGGVGE